MEQDIVLENKYKITLSQKAEVFVFACISFLSLMVPFGLGHPQWLVGAIVNACLFLSAIFLPRKYWLPIIVFPSLGVLARGLIFGPLTMFLVYFLPFIWLGNFILMQIFSSFHIRANMIWNNSMPARPVGGELSYIVPAIFSSVIKFAVLFLTANIYFKFHIVPKLFLQTMGLFQLYTALAGGVISFIIYKIFIKNKIL